MAVVVGHLIFMDANIALFRVWPVRLASTALATRLLYLVFGLLLAVIVGLTQWIRISSSSPKNTLESRVWSRFQLSYLSMMWILLG
ncbi:hypothetical protein PINS_up016390 [Pythium insidiosum]|nr:hypothetical protein PINS_up016390 [Pythium insidiosum]